MWLADCAARSRRRANQAVASASAIPPTYSSGEGAFCFFDGALVPAGALSERRGQPSRGARGHAAPGRPPFLRPSIAPATRARRRRPRLEPADAAAEPDARRRGLRHRRQRERLAPQRSERLGGDPHRRLGRAGRVGDRPVAALAGLEVAEGAADHVAAGPHGHQPLHRVGGRLRVRAAAPLEAEAAVGVLRAAQVGDASPAASPRRARRRRVPGARRRSGRPRCPRSATGRSRRRRSARARASATCCRRSACPPPSARGSRTRCSSRGR